MHICILRAYLGVCHNISNVHGLGAILDVFEVRGNYLHKISHMFRRTDCFSMCVIAKDMHLMLYFDLFQTGYSVVAACVVTLRWKNRTGSQVSSKCISSWCEGVICIFIVACCGFATGVLYRFGASFIFMIVAVVIAIIACAALCCRQVSKFINA